PPLCISFSYGVPTFRHLPAFPTRRSSDLALRAHNTAEQGNPYVVDLTSLTTSWNTQWGIGIIAKSSKVGASPNSFFNTLFSNSRSEEHTSELQSRENIVCRLLLEQKNASA